MKKSKFILFFNQINSDSVSEAGGKGASLGEMINSDIPVPNGFVVLADAFEKFIEITDLNIEIDAELDKVNLDVVHTIDGASERIQNMILSKDMPEEIIYELMSSFEELGSRYVAVRSSATSEDGADAAWAGQLDTFLNVTKDDLQESVRKCWASLFTPRAIFYRFEKGLVKEKISVAVVVQTMVNSEKSGIAFSVHPVTQNPNQLIIEAGFGLGEAIVSGQITPDSYVVDKKDLHIIDNNVNEQSKALYRIDGGGNEWKELSSEDASRQILGEKDILELSKLIINIEKHYGFPCDIEWAYENGKFFITQSRPITTLDKVNIIDEKIELDKFYTREHSLFYAWVWREGNCRKQKKWVDYNIEEILFSSDGKEVSVYYSENELLKFREAIKNKIINNKEWFEEFVSEFNILWEHLFSFVSGRRKVKSLADLQEFYEYWTDWWTPLAISMQIPEIESLAQDIITKSLELREKTQEYSDKGDEIYASFIDEFYPQFKAIKNFLTPTEVFKGISQEAVKKAEQRKNGWYLLFDKDGYLKELSVELINRNIKIPDQTIGKIVLNKEHSREYSLFKIAAWFSSLQNYFPKYVGKGLDNVAFVYSGKDLVAVYYDNVELEMVFAEILKPAKANPEKMIAMVKDFLELFEKLKEYFVGNKKVESVAELKQVYEDYSLYWMYVAIIFVLPGFDIDEDVKKQAFSARELTQEYNEHIEEVFSSFIESKYPYLQGKTRYILPEEIWSGDIDNEKAILNKIKERQAGYLFWQDKLYIGDIQENLDSLGIYLKSDIKEGHSKEITGQAAYNGNVTGRVRIISSADQIKNFQAGEILVAAMTMPKYLPAMRKAAAFVTDEGGITCHAAIISRELKKPCIIGTKVATDVLKNGDIVEVDADNGVVNIIDEDVEFLNALSSAGNWVSVLERDICVLIQSLILNGERSNLFNRALNKEIPPIGDAFVRKHIFSPMTSARNTIEAIEELTTANGYAILSKIASECQWRVKELHSFLEDNIDATLFNFIRFKELYSGVCSYLLVVVFTEKFLENRIEELIKDKCGEINKKYFEAIVYTEKFNKSTDELIDLMKLSLEIKENKLTLTDKVVIKKINNHLKKYAWLGGRWKFEESWSYENIEARIKNYLKADPKKGLNVIFDIRNNTREVTEEFINKYKLTTDEKEIIKVVKEFVFLRTFRTESLMYANSLFKLILSKISSSSVYSIEELFLLTVDELISLVNGDVDFKEDINNRENGYYMILYNNIVRLFVNDKLSQIDEMGLFKVDVDLECVIKGQTAWPGVVSGIVKIVREQSDIAKVKSGDVLVAIMTFPNYVPAMERAVAFVTNEGGILCHAAIISREMQKPCIIGTKNATEVLKDGDLIEVDADKGIVKILSEDKQILVNEFKESLDDDKPLVLRGKFIPLFLTTDWLHYYDEKFETKKSIYPALMTKHNGIHTYYLSQKKYIKAAKFGIQCYMKDESFIANIDSKYQKVVQKIDNMYKGYYDNKKINKESVLLKELEKIESYLHEIVALTLFIDFLDIDALKDVYSDTQNLNFKKIQECGNIYDFYSFDKKNNLEILEWVNKNPLYLKHVYTGYSSAPAEDLVLQKVNNENLEDLQEIVKQYEAEINKQKKIKKKLFNKLSKEEKSIVNFISWISELRDDRKLWMNKADALIHNYVSDLYSEWDIDQSLVCESYVFDILKGEDYIKKMITNIESRKGDFVNIYYGGSEYCEKFDDLESERLLEKTLEEPRESANFIKGQIANKGIVRGLVKIIFDPNRFHTFSEGDILVTSMTRPEFVPLMKKAIAIVTNEGGIACHAAIVSRELNKPCIIGTKNATEVLKDGDMVEVDADKGIVKILENKNEERIQYEELIHLDLPLSLVELHYEQESAIDIPWSSKRFNINPYICYKRENDQTYLYYDNIGIEWQIMQAGAFSDVNLAIKKIKNGFDKIKNNIENERALTLNEFKVFLVEIRLLWPWLNYMWWAIEYKEKNKEPFDELIEMRKYTEHFTPGLIAVFKNTIANIFPDKKKYVDFIKLDEILNNNIPNISELKKRINFVYTDKKIYKNWDDLLLDYNIEIKEKDDTGNDLSGQVAYPGKVEGTVRIISKREEVGEFNEGEILVSSTTTPDFLPAMKKSAAIISEHGGAICHAAITSRELKIPCIVGVRGATFVLKDGDLVEVDADNGVVKIIKEVASDKNYGEWEFEFQQRDHHPVVMADQWAKSFINFKDELELDVPAYDYIFDGESRGYNKIDQKKELLDKMLEACDKQDYLDFFFNKNMSRVEEMEDVCKSIADNLPEDNKGLIQAWARFNDSFLKAIPWFYFVYYLSEENFLTNKIKLKLNKYKEKIEKITDLNNALLILSYPDKKNKMQEEQMDFYELVKYAQHHKDYIKDNKFVNLVDNYLDDYAWLPTFIELPIELVSKEDVIEKISKFLQGNFIEEYETRKKKFLETKKIEDKIIKIIKKDKDLLNDILNAKKLGWMLSASVEDLLKATAKLVPFYKKIAQTIGVGYKDWVLFTIDEIERLLLGEKFDYNLVDRRKSYFYKIENGNREIVYGEEADKRTKDIDAKKNQLMNKVEEVKGVSVSSGKVRGIVRICMSPIETKKIEKGDILVCGMTSPDYVPAMRRASAILTDEGGLLCHAAIISRELDKPCIVGMKIISKAFKDGDLVEVDADNGIVKIIK